MAVVASQRESLGLMIGIRRLSILRHVAGGAVGKHAVLPAHQGLVAAFAFNGGVRSEERKQIVVVADLRFGSEPALGDVTLGAIRAEFAQMNVGVAVVAILADVGENCLGVALRAREFFVSAA